MTKIIALGTSIAFIVIVLFFLVPFTIIGAGERGVVMHNGKVEDQILNEGLHFYIPVITTIKKLDVRVKSISNGNELVAGSAENQSILVKWTVNYHINPTEVNKSYQELGAAPETFERIISGRVEERVKSVIAKISAVDVLRESIEIKTETKKQLTEDLLKYHIIVDDFIVNDLDYLPAYNAAIENKVRAQQEAEAEKNKLESVKLQAQQKIETAKGDAEAQRLQQQTLTDVLLRKQWIEKWNGILPQYVTGGEAAALIQLPK